MSINLEKLYALHCKLKSLGFSDSEIMEAWGKRIYRDEILPLVKVESGIFSMLDEGKTVYFYDSRRDSTLHYEVSAYSYDPDLEDLRYVIHSPYDCTGKRFTCDIRKFFNAHLNKWIVIHLVGLDV